MIPFPSEEATPPVTNIYFVSATIIMFCLFSIIIIIQGAKLQKKYEISSISIIFYDTLCSIVCNISKKICKFAPILQKIEYEVFLSANNFNVIHFD